MNETPVRRDPVRRKPGLVGAVLAGSVALVAAVTGLVALGSWTALGTVPGARDLFGPWPLAFGGALVLLAALGLRGRSTPALALALLAWCFGVTAAVELPAWTSAWHLGDGPGLVPVYLAFSLVGGLYALGAWPARLGGGASFEVRGAVLLLLFTTAGGKAWTREGELVFPLLAAAVLLLWALTERRWTLAALVRTPLGFIALAFLLWTLFAALGADNPRRGLWFWMRVLTGALAAWTLAGSLSARGAARAVWALPVALVVALTVLVAGWLEVLPSVGATRLFASRLRLFDLHPNGIGPFFAASSLACLGLALGRVRAPRGARSAPVALVTLGGLAALCLVRTESRASLLGFALGLAVLAWGASGRLPRRPLRFGAALLGALAAGALALASPLGAGLRERLHSTTLTNSALGQRVHFWEMALAVLRDSPWLGAGPAQYHAHTRYAAPSFYDGTAQDLHTHNLPLAVAEGAGWPALLLFLLLVLGTFELLRRALVQPAPASTDVPGVESDADAGARRGASLALAAALAAVLGSNLLDLGLSQTTFLPLALWTSLGLAAALAGSGEVSPAPQGLRSAPRASAALLFAVPLTLLPTASLLLFRAGNLDQARLKSALALGDLPAAEVAAQRALERYELARDVAFDQYDRPDYAIVTLHRITGRGPEAVAAQAAACASAPTRARSRFALAKLELENGRVAQGRRSVELARELDPYGPDMGNYAFGLAWADLLAGRVDEARAHLREGIELGGALWERLPRTDLPPTADDPDREREGARRIAFVPVGAEGRERAPIPMDELLEELLEEILREPTMRGIRTAIQIVNLYREQGRPSAALDVIERIGATDAAPAGSLRILHATVLGELDRAGESVAVLEELLTWSYGRRSSALTLARVLGASEDEAHRARARELVRDLEQDAGSDLFFTAGLTPVEHEVIYDLYLEEGDWSAAAARARLAVFDTERVADRVAVAGRCFNRLGRAAKRDGSAEAREALLEVFDLLLEQTSLDGATAGNTPAMELRAGNLRRWWTGSEDGLQRAVAAVTSGRGQAGHLFQAKFEGRDAN